MFAGRTLLVADESPYYQTVLGLTFADEGMKVVMAGDGHEALAKLEQSAPDLIIASVSLPGISGSELCRIVKQDERFGGIPVMLLVGSHESFDEPEARRAGADDVVTKPFKSIRQLVGRVGSLLAGKGAAGEAGDFSTLGLDRSQPEAAPGAVNQALVSDNNTMVEPNVHVFVEAPVMSEHDSMNIDEEPAGSTCAADVELQTADTQKLERIDDEAATDEPIKYAQDDTRELPRVLEPESSIAPVDRSREPSMELEPEIEMKSAMLSEDQWTVPALVEGVKTSTMDIHEMNETISPQSTPSAVILNDSLLDLDDFDSAPQTALADDLVLDLDYDAPQAASAFALSEVLPEPFAPVAVPVQVIEVEPTYEDPAVTADELREWNVVAESAAEASSPVNVQGEDRASADPSIGLSPEAVNAIVTRVVEQLSEKVVREIAWEVVPELAELLIKKKLEEQR